MSEVWRRQTVDLPQAGVMGKGSRHYQITICYLQINGDNTAFHKLTSHYLQIVVKKIHEILRLQP
jgi:hypothetical protein